MRNNNHSTYNLVQRSYKYSQRRVDSSNNIELYIVIKIDYYSQRNRYQCQFNEYAKVLPVKYHLHHYHAGCRQHLCHLIRPDRVVGQTQIRQNDESAERHGDQHHLLDVDVLDAKDIQLLADYQADKRHKEMYHGQGDIRKAGVNVEPFVQEHDHNREDYVQRQVKRGEHSFVHLRVCDDVTLTIINDSVNNSVNDDV